MINIDHRVACKRRYAWECKDAIGAVARYHWTGNHWNETVFLSYQICHMRGIFFSFLFLQCKLRAWSGGMFLCYISSVNIVVAKVKLLYVLFLYKLPHKPTLTWRWYALAWQQDTHQFIGCLSWLHMFDWFKKELIIWTSVFDVCWVRVFMFPPFFFFFLFSLSCPWESDYSFTVPL